MNLEERLASIVTALESVGISCLVMGGHAVRHYGLQRYTNDFDFTIAPDSWNDLATKLVRARLFANDKLVEGNSWRPGAFRRFQIGTLAGGQEEWLEFWHKNHLLDPFPDLLPRREVAKYGSRDIPFLGLDDLLRSKETERAKDWDDVAYLEEVRDARLHQRFLAGAARLSEALRLLRSQRGFDLYLSGKHFNDNESVQAALSATVNPITQAMLIPFAPSTIAPAPVSAIEPLVEKKLRTIVPASSIHRALVEVVRRSYKVFCQNRDRADKDAIRVAQESK